MAKGKKIRKQLAADADPELIQKIGHELIDRGLTLREAMDQAFRAWLPQEHIPSPTYALPTETEEGDPRNQVSPLAEILPSVHINIPDAEVQTEEHRRIVEMLRYILQVNDPGIITALRHNLDTFARLARLEDKSREYAEFEAEAVIETHPKDAGSAKPAEKHRRSGKDLRESGGPPPRGS